MFCYAIMIYYTISHDILYYIIMYWYFIILCYITHHVAYHT